MFRDVYKNEMTQFLTQVFCESIASTFHSSMQHSDCTFFQFSFKLSSLLLTHWDLIKWVFNWTEKQTILCEMRKRANYSSVILYCSRLAFWQVDHWKKGSNDENCKSWLSRTYSWPMGPSDHPSHIPANGTGALL